MSTSLVQNASAAAAPSDVAPPLARKIPKSVEAPAGTRVDNYFWLREKTNPDVIAHLEAENKYTAAMLAGAEKLQEKLYSEMLGRIKQTDLSVPVLNGGYYYYSRTEEGKQYPILCRRKGSLTAPEQILLDQNALAQGQKYFRIGGFVPSPDHTMVAFSTDYAGDEVYTLRVKNLETGAMLPDEVKGVYYGFVWAADNETLFYSTVDAAKRPYKVFRHVLGGKSETEVYHEKDERYNVTIAKSKSREFIFINLESKMSSEVRYFSASTPTAAPQVFLPRATEIEYDLTHRGDEFFVRINDKGRNFRVVRTPVAKIASANWREYIAHRDDTFLEGVDAFAAHLLVYDRNNGLRRLRIDDLKDGASHYIRMAESAYSLFPSDNPEYNSNILRYGYASLVTPTSTFDYNMDARTQELKKRQEVLGGYDPRLYVTERVFATARDGVKIPIALVYKKGFVKNGEAPGLLYGYGSYGINSEATFDSGRLSLLDRGFVYAIANIRGGSEMGKKWHEDGRMMSKRNTFTDFIAAAEYLQKEKYSSARRLGILGGSAGGLLMGAVTNMRPDLFGAVVAKVPFVDVVNSMLDETLPLTVGEFEEWGNPKEPKAYSYMLSYSPYDNVESQKFPHILVTAGLNDPRVPYWEPAKWVAKLRTMKKDSNMLLLKTNMSAGHAGASGRYDRLRETALDYAFLLVALGVEKLPVAAEK